MRPGDVPLLGVVLVVLLAALLAWPPIATRGEAREGLVVRELAAGGSWVLPRRQGVIASKPPLYHWLAAGAVGVFGWSDAAVRLPSVLAAWTMALETFALGLLAAGRGAAWLAVGILIAAWGFSRAALEARVDVLFSACVAGSIVAFGWWALREAPRGRTICWLAAAAAVLAKGPVGIVLPALVAVAYLVARGESARLRALWSWPAAAATLALTGGWYAAATAAGGRAFLAVQVVKENLDRVAGLGEFASSSAFAWLRMPRLFLGHLAPWNLAIVDDVQRWRRGAPLGAADTLLHCWWLVVLGVFSLAADTRSVYLLPLYPAIAVLAARSLLRHVASGTGRVLVAAGVGGIALLGLALSHRALIRKADAHGLEPLARATARLVPPGASLRASRGLAESDLLVLAYLLQRPLTRDRVSCDRANAATYYLRPVRTGTAATPVERVAASRGVELVRCKEFS